MNEAVLALMGTLFGATGLKVVEHLLTRNKVKVDDAANFRKELREEVATLRGELKNVEDELDKWKDKYYTLLAQFHAERTLDGKTHAGLPTDSGEETVHARDIRETISEQDARLAKG